jgi:hypothetical protein
MIVGADLLRERDVRERGTVLPLCLFGNRSGKPELVIV